MGTTAEKLTHLSNTKTAIHDAIVAKGVEIPEGTTFQEYADKIANISTGLSDKELALANATSEKVLNGYKFYAGNDILKTGTALSTSTSVTSDKLFNGVTAYNNSGNLITGTALSENVTVTASKMFKGVTAYNQNGTKITGNPASTNVTAQKMFTGTTAFNQNGTLITGAPTATTATASDIASGKTAYKNNGTLMTGTGTLISGTAYKVYTGEVDSRTTTVYLDNIRYAMFGTRGLSSGDGISYAGGTAGTVNRYNIQVVLSYGQVVDAGNITITSSYISYEPGYISSLDYVAICEI